MSSRAEIGYCKKMGVSGAVTNQTFSVYTKPPVGPKVLVITASPQSRKDM